MTFNSLAFLIFYPIVLLLYFLLPHKYRWVMLLVASYYFYMSWKAELIFLILFTTAVSYAAGRIIQRSQRKTVRRVWLILALVTSLGVLFFFKYFNFLSASVTGVLSAFGLPQSEVALNLILPVGISFYTFQTLSYVIDVYRGSIPAERHFGYYALFVSFFPQLVAGPIERPENLLPQLKAEHHYHREDAAAGGKRMLVGFFKKVVVADLIAPYVNAVFNHPDSASAPGIILGSMLFAVQIYCDFAGYTDIAIGCARVMGIRLMQNFDHPYAATGIRDFWARWHISLSTWFRDYLYIPLGGSRCSKARHLTNLMIVFLVSGLWHGANWTFVLWGFLHGLYQVVGILTKPLREKLYQAFRIPIDAKGVIGMRRVVTFLLVCFAWIFFRANSTGDLGLLLSRLFTGWSGVHLVSEMGITLTGMLAVLGAIAVMIVLDRRFTGPDPLPLSGQGSTVRSTVPSTMLRGGTVLYLIWAVIFAWMILLAGNGASTFIYFQF